MGGDLTPKYVPFVFTPCLARHKEPYTPRQWALCTRRRTGLLGHRQFPRGRRAEAIHGPCAPAPLRRAWGFQRRPARDTGSRDKWPSSRPSPQRLPRPGCWRSCPSGQSRCVSLRRSPAWSRSQAQFRRAVGSPRSLFCKMWEQRQRQPLQPLRRPGRRQATAVPLAPRPGRPHAAQAGSPRWRSPDRAAGLTPPSLRARGPGSTAPGGAHNPTCHIADFWRAVSKTRVCPSRPGRPTGGRTARLRSCVTSGEA